MRRRLNAVFTGWVQLHRELLENRHKVKVVLLRIKNRAMAGAFHGWHDIVVEKDESASCPRAVKKMLHRQLAGVDGWYTHVADRKRARTVVSSILTRMKHKELHMAWAHWFRLTLRRSK